MSRGQRTREAMCVCGLIPPTKAALEEHVKRASYQGGHVWGQTLVVAPEITPPNSWDWAQNEDEMYHPHWPRLPEAAQTCIA